MAIGPKRRQGFLSALIRGPRSGVKDVLFSPRMRAHFDLSRVKGELDAQDKRLKSITEEAVSVDESPYGAGDFERHIKVAGLLRRYEMHIPRNYMKEYAWPVVFNFHGGAARAGIARWNTRMDETSDQKGFIVVYPEGTGIWGDRFLTWNAGLCCGYAVTHRVDDISFVAAVLSDLKKYFRIDENRIYATGFSNGAMLAYRVACELSDRFAAIAPVSGGLCTKTAVLQRPVSLMHFHGTDDQYYPYKGGVGPRSVTKTNFPSVEYSIAQWIAFTGCDQRPAQSVQKKNVRTDRYRAVDGTEVVLVTVNGGGHSWPGGKPVLRQECGGPVCNDVSANDLMWDFFSSHPLRAE